MGMIQKILWWILYYAVTWFCLVIVWGIIEDTGIFPKAFMGFLILAVFLVPGWYANRKVKQKALKKEMEQRAGNFAFQQPVQSPPSTAPNPMSQITNNVPHQTQDRTIPQSSVMQEKVAIPAPNAVTISSTAPSQENLPNLNSASVDDLTKLSVVNRILAMKIISVRDKDGTYSSFEDLFTRVQLTPQAQEELRRHFSIVQANGGRFIDF